ncbi:MAG TPA: 23S rRNA (guanosine(2251)-2'-O)-methyltransferase RlmB [Oligoflexia bacterium]|nr:23S rRNA (guanosine(2251)-2'-O)-methyltransferase RlmB [Oligoflexia bacterium]HMP27136.1 23S rRNA (guanosine(2251)-2'-O)-methyltransferase RlmB [Oligoflexia bacterium]
MGKKRAKDGLSDVSSWRHSNKGMLLAAPRNFHYVIGRNAVRETLLYAASRVRRIYLTPEAKIDLADPLSRMQTIEIKEFGRHELTKLVGTESHQGVVAEVADRQQITLDEMLRELAEVDRALLVLVDNLSDPQNFGAVIRASECFGASALIYSNNRSPKFGAVISKASAGASEVLPLVSVSNLAQALCQIKESGFWVIASALPESDPLSTPPKMARKWSDFHRFSFPPKSAVIVGSEADGVSRLIKERSDSLITIPMGGRLGSLNVSQATAVLLSRWVMDNHQFKS